MKKPDLLLSSTSKDVEDSSKSWHKPVKQAVIFFFLANFILWSCDF